MKSLSERKNEIYNKIANINSLKEKRSEIDKRVFNEDGTYNWEALDEYLAMGKKVNYAEGGVKRMIKRLMNDIYGGWSFSNEEYPNMVYEFKRFA